MYASTTYLFEPRRRSKTIRRLQGRLGLNVFAGPASAAVINGTAGNDTFFGTPHDDTVTEASIDQGDTFEGARPFPSCRHDR
jgi:hypothetical protein